MRWLFTLGMLLGVIMTTHAETYLYVSMAPEQKIQIFKLDTKDGKLTPVDAIAVEGAPGSLAVDPSKKYLYASLRSTSSLASFAIDGATGKLKHLSTVELVKGENAAFVATDRSGRWLLSASYAAGKIVVHEIKDGKIQSPATQSISTTKTAHAIAQDKENQFVFVPHVTPNAIYQYKLDVSKGMLTEAGKAPGGSDKAGPRHLAFHPSGKFAFSSDEVSNAITSYEFDAKSGLKPIHTLPTLPSDFKTANTTAEVKVHPNGKFVWVSNRGHDSLAGFSIDTTNGKVTSLGQTPTEKTPRSFDISPDGKFLFGAGEGTGKLAIYQIDMASGKLTRIATQEIGKSLTWVMTLELGGK